MSGEASLLELALWRRQTAELYAAVRGAAESEAAAACQDFRGRRDQMFAAHPQSPLDDQQKQAFQGLSYFPYNPGLRLRVPVLPIVDEEKPPLFELPEGPLRIRRFGRVVLAAGTLDLDGAILTLYWVEGYGGGLFLPFKDMTSGGKTYGGGRYLYDTIKGADLGAGNGELIVDFNYAYNPSCAYNPRWICPLSPRENALHAAIEAGELAF